MIFNEFWIFGAHSTLSLSCQCCHELGFETHIVVQCGLLFTHVNFKRNDREITKGKVHNTWKRDLKAGITSNILSHYNV